MKRLDRTSMILGGTALVLLSAAQLSRAQVTAAGAPAAESSDGEIGEIVVTAQRRSENLQKVPVSVTALSGASALADGVTTAADLQMVVPGMTVQANTTATIFYIRGIGTETGSPGLDNTIATFIDGVYIPSMTGSTLSLNNIDRVEVLKGPQGTLYGRNATGGAINIITKTPSQETSMEGYVGYGNLDTTEASFYATTGLGSHAAADIAVYYHDQGDGFGHDLYYDNSSINKERDFNARSKLLVDLSDQTHITLAGDFDSVTSSYAIAFRAVPSSSLLDGQIGYTGGYYNTDTDGVPTFTVHHGGGSLKFEQDAGNFSFNSLSAYRYQAAFQNIDVDTTPIDLLQAPLHTRDGQFTEELQAAYNTQSLNGVLGVFYLSGYNQYDPFEINGLGVAPLTSLLTEDKQETTSAAVYGQGTYEFLPQTHITLGARYTHDKRRFEADQNGVEGGAVFPIAGRIDEHATFSKPTWRVALDHEIVPDMMAYISYSRGFKSGVYNLSAPGNPVVKPETLDAYEIGLKSVLFDRKIRFNPAVFYYDYKNIQLSLVNGASTTIFNAATARLYGVDADLDYVVTRDLTLQGGFSWIHAYYSQFPGAPLSTPNLAPPFGNTIDPGSANGRDLIMTPDSTANLSAQYKVPVATGAVGANVGAAYNSGFFWSPDNRVRQPSYTLLNAQLVWYAPGEKFNVRLWGKNLTNKEYLTTVNENATGDIGAPAPGRTYGVSFGFKY